MFGIAPTIPYSTRGASGFGTMTPEQTAAFVDTDELFREAQDLITFPLFGSDAKARAQQIANTAMRLHGEVESGMTPATTVAGEIPALRAQLTELERKRRINIALFSVAMLSVATVGGYYGYRVWKKKR